MINDVSLISVNIPVYNRSMMIRECIESFKKQTFKNFEIVIVDDGSTENISFIKGMDARVKYIRQEHKGIAAAFNNAFDNSVGKYIIPFGSDDLPTPKLLEDTLSLMQRYTKHYDVIYPNKWIMNSNGRLHRSLLNKTLNSKDAYQKMLTKQYISHGGSLWKKECLPRYDESLESAVDWELFLKAMENGVRFKHLRTKLWIYRTGHQREEGTERQIRCCDIILRRRGYYFDKKTRTGIKLCN